MTTDPVDGMKLRLRSDLKAAMQAKRAVEMKALRALLGAIDNAQSVPVPETRGYVSRAFGDESGEVPRLALSGDALRAVIAREAASHRAAAAEMALFGRTERAEALDAEAEIVERYLVG
jgi:uncharacterized protein YqeY